MKHLHRSLLLLTSLLTLAACTDNSSSGSQPPAEPVKPVAKTTTPAVDHQATATDSKSPSAADGIALPLEFSLTDLDGNQVTAEDYRGQWLVINYWATWCAPCRDEMPELVKFQNENDQVQILGIAYEDADVQKLKNFAQDFNINYPLLTIDVYNPPGFAEEGGLGLPTTIVYNPEGMRHKKHMGPIDAEGLLEMVQ